MATGKDSTPPLKRAGTMDITALEGAELLTHKGTTVEETADHLRSGHVFKSPEAIKERPVEEGASGSNDDVTKRSPLKRAGTMTRTIEDAKRYFQADKTLGDYYLGIIEEGGKDGAEKDEDNTDGTKEVDKRGQLHRTSTIQATVEDAKHILGADELGKTRGQDVTISSHGTNEKDSTPHRAPLQRTPTMAATLEDAKHILGSEEGHLGRTRGQDASGGLDEKDSTPHRAPLQRTQTMAATLEDAKHILGDESLGRTRGQDAPTSHDGGDEQDSTPHRAPLQRTQTMAETIKEAKDILGDEELGRTRKEDEPGKADASTKKKVTISEDREVIGEHTTEPDGARRGVLKRSLEVLEEEEEEIPNKKKL